MKKKQLSVVGVFINRIYWNQLFLSSKAKAYFYRGDIGQLHLDSMWQKIATLNVIGRLCLTAENTTKSDDVDIFMALGSIIYDFEQYCFDDNVGTIGTMPHGWPKREDLRQLLKQIRVFLEGRGLTDLHPVYKTPCYPELNPRKLKKHTVDTIKRGDVVVTEYSNMRLLVLDVVGKDVVLTSINREITCVQRMQVPIEFTYQASFFG